jgi:hypothetical protein
MKAKSTPRGKIFRGLNPDYSCNFRCGVVSGHVCCVALGCTPGAERIVAKLAVIPPLGARPRL